MVVRLYYLKYVNDAIAGRPGRSTPRGEERSSVFRPRCRGSARWAANTETKGKARAPWRFSSYFLNREHSVRSGPSASRRRIALETRSWPERSARFPPRANDSSPRKRTTGINRRGGLARAGRFLLRSPEKHRENRSVSTRKKFG